LFATIVYFAQNKNMKSFIFFLLLISQIAIAQSPNILLVIADDIGVGEIPNYPPSVIKANMPHLEALMQQGLTFDNAWSNPVCAPSRANILTGKHGFRTNVLNAQSLATLSIDETSLHEYIDQTSNGLYSNSLIGKWHLGGGGMNPIYDYPNELGIDYFAGILGGGVGNYNNYTFVEDMQGAISTDYITTKITDLAIDWINDQNQPWFCWVAYNGAHTPLHLPPVNMHTQGSLPTDQASIDANPHAYFLAMIESVDFEMGRLMDNIPADELENTIILFVGDNGTSGQTIQAPYTSNRAKGSLHQGGVHVPMVIAGAGVTRVDEREAALVGFSDLFATIVEMTGTPLAEIHDSRSFASLLTEAGPGPRDCLYTEVSMDGNSSGWAARDETFKLIKLDNGNQRFYNLINDPYEENNLMPNLNNNQQAAFDKLITVRDVLSSVDAEIETETALQLFPNPAYSELSLIWKGGVNETGIIYDLYGKKIWTGDVHPGSNSISIDDFPTGLYFINVGNAAMRFMKK